MEFASIPPRPPEPQEGSQGFLSSPLLVLICGSCHATHAEHVPVHRLDSWCFSTHFLNDQCGLKQWPRGLNSPSTRHDARQQWRTYKWTYVRVWVILDTTGRLDSRSFPTMRQKRLSQASKSVGCVTRAFLSYWVFVERQLAPQLCLFLTLWLTSANLEEKTLGRSHWLQH